MGAADMRTETIVYRDYELQVTHNPLMWNVGVYPSRPDLPMPGPEDEIIALGDREQAIAVAKGRVDALLSGA